MPSSGSYSTMENNYYIARHDTLHKSNLGEILSNHIAGDKFAYRIWTAASLYLNLLSITRFQYHNTAI